MSWELIYYLSGIAILPVFIIAVVISIRVEVVINKYSRQAAGCGLTAKDLVEKIATAENLMIQVEMASNSQGDHYDPRTKTVRLTEKVMNADSIAALAIAAHECGHALQDQQNYAPLKIRQIAIKLSNFASRLLTPLIILSVLASLFVYTMAGFEFMKWLLLGFCIVYGLAAVVSLVTLPTEFDASRRGKALLKSMNVVETHDEQRAVNKVLGAAANTYVVSFALSMLYFLRYLAVFMNFFDRRR